MLTDGQLDGRIVPGYDTSVFSKRAYKNEVSKPIFWEKKKKKNNFKMLSAEI